MNRRTLTLLLALTIPFLAPCLLSTLPAFARGGGGAEKAPVAPSEEEAAPVEKLTKAEIAGLLFMREEEKLARDVYLTLLEAHEHHAFKNISGAEQRHMDALLGLLTKYEIPDVVGDNAIGVFRNETLQALYTDLIAIGKKSLPAALTVGATVEDRDIHDLAESLKLTKNADLRAVYENLMRGSRNHLRAFTRQLGQHDLEYQPAYLTPEEYDAIIASPQECGPGMGRGRGGQGGHGGHGGGRRHRGGR